jgi:hypothetical protein
MNSLSPAEDNDALELVHHNNMRELELELQQPASEAFRGSIFATHKQSMLGLRPQSDVILPRLSVKRDYLFDALNYLRPSQCQNCRIGNDPRISLARYRSHFRAVEAEAARTRNGE